MRRLRLIITLASIATFLSPVPYSHASNPTCNPTLANTVINTIYRVYKFTSTTTCDWVMPSNAGSIAFVEMVGGGGGGGAGSFSNTSPYGGGGGGGGTGQMFYKTSPNFTIASGTSLTISVGSGGSGGGASTLGATGGNGGNGSASSIVPATGTTLTAAGGGGGGGGSTSVGGVGGGASGRINDLGTLASNNGGAQNSGNGGGGAMPTDAGNDAFSFARGPSYPVSLYDLALSSGNGGNSALNTAVTPNAGTANSGSGGDAGMGLHGSSANSNTPGAAGGSGVIYIGFTFGVSTQHASDIFTVGVPVNTQIATFTPGVGQVVLHVESGSWPDGLTFNESTATLTGTPTTAQSSSSPTLRVNDNTVGPYFNYSLTINKGTQTPLTLTSRTMILGDTVTLLATGGSGTGTISYSTSNSTACPISGSNSNVLTAASGTGTCTITATNPGDSNWNSTSITATITLTKTAPHLTLSSASLLSPTNSVILLSTTLASGATGTVTFKANGAGISGCGSSGVVTISAAAATCSWTPSSSAGSPYTITALYSGDSSYNADTASVSNIIIYTPISLSYSNITTTLGSAATSAPTVSGGNGSTSAWTWTVVKASDSSTVSGITIPNGTVTVDASMSPGTYSMVVTATDSQGIVKTTPITITSTRVAVTLSYSSISSTYGTLTTASPTVSGGVGSPSSWTWAVVQRSDSATITGVTISSTGVISADSTTASGSYLLAVTGTDTVGTAQTAFVNLTVTRIAINLSYTDTSTTFGTAITIPVSVSGGVGSPSTWTWTMVKASDSSTVYQMSISGGVITVSNTTPGGTYAMVVSATDGAGTVKTAPITITVTKVYGTVTIRAANISGTTVTGVTVNRQIQLMGSTGVGGGGTMVFYANGTAVCSFVSIFNGTGSCWWGVSDTSTAIFNIYAVYSGDSSVYGGTSNTLTNFPVNAAMHVTYNDIHVSNGYSSTSAPTATGGTGAPNTWTWTMSQHFTGQQISGITINSSTGVVSVASNTANGTYAMDIYPADPTNATSVASITIYVANMSTPTIVLWNNGETVSAGSPISGYFLLSTGGSIDTFTISPAAPAGMTFNTNTGVFSGSPTTGPSTVTYTITGFNSVGSASATYLLVVQVNNSGTTITIALSGGGTTAYMRTAVGVVATASQDGKVTFYSANKPIPGCRSLSTSSKTVTCSWKPAAHGSAVLYAALKPNSGSYTSSRSANLGVGVGLRSGTR
jgi:hypothetical protein